MRGEEMSKVTGPSGADFQTTDNVDSAGPPPDVAPGETKEGWLSTAFNSVIDTVESAPGNIANGLVDTAKAGLDVVMLPAAMPKYVFGEVQTFLNEKKYEDLTLNPSAALKRCVEGANDTLKETYGAEALQITTDPKLEDVIYTAQVLTGQTDKTSQLRTAAAAFGVGVAHENIGVVDFAKEGPAYQALSENAGTVLNTVAGIGAGALCPPLGIAILASGPIKGFVNDAFRSIDENVAQLRSDPAATRAWVSVLTLPVEQRLEKMPVGDVLKQSFSTKIAVYDGVGGSLDLEVSRTIKKLEDGYEVTIKSKGGSELGLGLGAQDSTASTKFAGESGVESKFVVKGEGAEKFIAGTSNGLEALFADNSKVQLSSGDVNIEQAFGIEGDFGGGTTSAKVEFKNLQPSQLSAEFKLSNAFQFHMSGLPPEDDRSLKDCLKSMIEPSLSNSVKAEAKVGLEDDKFSAELKLTTTSGADRIEAEIKFEIKDPQRLADHLKIPVNELKNLSAEMMLEKVGSIPSDMMEISVSITGYEGYMGAKAKIPGMSIGVEQEHPTYYVRIPDPNNSDKSLSASLTDAHQQIVALSEGWNNERPVSLKA